jgi:hypothetical protein
MDNASLRLSRSSSISSVLSKSSREDLPRASSAAGIWIQEWSQATSNQSTNGESPKGTKFNRQAQRPLKSTHCSRSSIYMEPPAYASADFEEESVSDEDSKWTSQPQKTLYQKFKIPKNTLLRNETIDDDGQRRNEGFLDVYPMNSTRQSSPQRRGRPCQDRLKVLGLLIHHLSKNECVY